MYRKIEALIHRKVLGSRPKCFLDYVFDVTSHVYRFVAVVQLADGHKSVCKALLLFGLDLALAFLVNMF